MLVLFCEDPIQPGRVDESFDAEARACDAAGLPHALVSFEQLVAGDAAGAVRRVPNDAGLAIYRGWMLRPPQYAALHAALLARGVTMLTSPSAYAWAHELPGWYATLEGQTPRSIWLQSSADLDFARVHAALAAFGDRALVVKDHVKSRKHEWNDACFIRAASDRAEVERVVGNFARRQDADLQGGLVFREFVELEPVGAHPKSKMPLSNEWRLFYFKGQRLAVLRYWDDGAYPGEQPPLERFDTLATKVPSPFFALDVARTKRGEWIVMELGDGQVSGLPAERDATAFYASLFSGWSSGSSTCTSS